MESKSTAIYNYLERKIVQGFLKPGDKLPSESELCTRFNVSRAPVRAALDKLSALGLVFKKKGGGSYVSEQGMDNLLNILLPSLKKNAVDSNEIMEIRCALDKLCVDLCLNSHDSNDYAPLEQAMKTMIREMDDRESFFELDRAFHTALSLLSGNFLLHNINLLLWDLLKSQRPRDYRNRNIQDLVNEHKRIYKSIRDNDRELALLHTVRHLKRSVTGTLDKTVGETDKKRWNPWLFNTL